MRWQTGAAVALLAALATVAVVAFVRDGTTPGAAASPTPTTAATAAPSPSPSPDPSPAGSPSPGPVLPGNDVDDPLEAIVAIEAFRDWLFENPDPDLVRFIYHPECGCTEPLQSSLEALVADRQHIRMSGSTDITELQLEREQDERVVVVQYVARTPALELIDSSGAVSQSHEESEPRRFRTQLVRSDGGRWLVVHIEELA